MFLAREFPFFSSFFVRRSREYDFATPSSFRGPLRQGLGVTFDGAIVNERMLILFLNFQSEEYPSNSPKKPSITPSFEAKYTNTGNTRVYGAGNPINYQITSLRKKKQGKYNKQGK